jgi:hypothetical protein
LKCSIVSTFEQKNIVERIGEGKVKCLFEYLLFYSNNDLREIIAMRVELIALGKRRSKLPWHILNSTVLD